MAGRDEYDLQSLKAMLDCLLSSVRTRLEVAAVLSHAPTATSGVGTTPMASRAADRLRHAVIRLMAANARAVDTRAAGARTIDVTAQRDT